MRRHDGIRDCIAEWVPHAKVEQSMPKWDTPAERAVLDVAYRDRTGAETCVDVSVVAAAAIPCLLMRRELAKHRRYPGPGLIPFALASRGRWGREAAGWARAVARSAFGAMAAEKFHQLRYAVAVALQAEVAEQLLTCMEGTPERS